MARKQALDGGYMRKRTKTTKVKTAKDLDVKHASRVRGGYSSSKSGTGTSYSQLSTSLGFPSSDGDPKPPAF